MRTDEAHGSEIGDWSRSGEPVRDDTLLWSDHLLGVDNDPDARGPNRIVHIVLQGDYG